MICNAIRVELLPQIHMYYHHSDKRIRELATVVLTNINDNLFLSIYGNSQSWIKSLDISEKRKEEAISKFTNEETQLHQFLNPTLNFDTVCSFIKNLELKTGVALEITASVAKIRKENEDAQKQILEKAQDILTKERNSEITFKNEISAPSNSVKTKKTNI